MFPVGSSVKGAWRELKENRFVCLLADQDAGRDGLFVPLLGRDASTATGPASLALRSGAEMIPGFILRRGGGRHHMVIEPPIALEAGVSPEEAVARATQRYVEILESYLKRYPDHWFWVHRRWKTRPARSG
jgi:KDO2-lipid IV(A) lauroyltransferase